MSVGWGGRFYLRRVVVKAENPLGEEDEGEADDKGTGSSGRFW